MGKTCGNCVVPACVAPQTKDTEVSKCCLIVSVEGAVGNTLTLVNQVQCLTVKGGEHSIVVSNGDIWLGDFTVAEISQAIGELYTI